MPAQKEKTPVEKVDLKVTVDNHTHAGKPVKKGGTIQVTQKQKDRFEKEWTPKNSKE